MGATDPPAGSRHSGLGIVTGVRLWSEGEIIVEGRINLTGLVRSYLESAGYNLSDQGHCLVADKLVFGAERDTRLVWASDRNWEEDLLWNSIS